MRLLATLFIMTSVALGLAAPASADVVRADSALDDTAVGRYVDSYLDRHGLPGAAVAVVKDGQVAHLSGHGENHGEPLDADTPLRLSSVSKSFTAFAVLQLVDEGAVDLDQPVMTYLPTVRIDDDRADQITVRQLLSHTSGLPNPTVIGPAATLEEGVARLADWQLSTTPGTTYSYSNADYWVAAQLVERLRGAPLADVLTERIFEPLGMDDTTATVTTTGDVPGLRTGHVTAYGLAAQTREPAQMVAGAGGVVSTAHDMAAWLAMQQREGTTPTGERLLSADLIEESHRAQPSAGRTGFGWMRSKSTSPQRISHSGVFATYNAQQDLVPSSGYGVAVLLPSNTTTREHAYAISGGIIDITEGRTPDSGAPVPTIIDLVLAAVTLLAAGLGVRGMLRSDRWADRRASHPRWKLGLRLLPQLLAPALAVFLFAVAPMLQDNSLTSGDVLRLFPSFMILLLVLAGVGMALTISRLAHTLGRPDRRGPGQFSTRSARPSSQVSR